MPLQLGRVGEAVSRAAAAGELQDVKEGGGFGDDW